MLVDDLLDTLTLGPSKERLQSPLGAQRFVGPDFASVSLVDWLGRILANENGRTNYELC